MAGSNAPEDRWLGHSPGGWEGGDGSHGSFWGWLCRTCVTQSLEDPLSHSVLPGKGGDIGLRAKPWAWQSTSSPRAAAPWGRAQAARSPQSELGSALALGVDRDTVVWARMYVPELGTNTHPSTPHMPALTVPGSSLRAQKWVRPTGPSWGKTAWGGSTQEVINSISKVHVAGCLATPWGGNEDLGERLSPEGCEGGGARLQCSAFLRLPFSPH